MKCPLAKWLHYSEYLEDSFGGQSKVPVGGQTGDEEEDPEVDDMY